VLLNFCGCCSWLVFKNFYFIVFFKIIFLFFRLF
jgi:hypothetical protein